MAGPVKVTFTVDEATLARLNDAAERLGAPKSQIVREAVLDFCQRINRLSERDRLQLLSTFDELVPRIRSQDAGEADPELKPARQSRTPGRRRTASRDRK